MLKKISFRNYFLASFFILFASFSCFGGSPYIVLSGPDTVTLEMGYTYLEPGYTAYSSKGGNITASVTRKSSVPNSFKLTSPALIVGTYKISYDVKDSSGTAAATQYRYVVVLKDTARPKLVVAGPDTTFVIVNKKSTGFVTLPTIISSDDLVDGTTADTIKPSNIPVNKLDTVKVLYSTADGSGNRAIVYRWVIVYDNVAPVIKPRFINDTAYLGSLYHDSVSITDNYYSSLKISRDGQFYKSFPTGIPDSLGTYAITFTATDGSGNTSTFTQYVTVKDTFAPVVTIAGKVKDTMYLFNTYVDKGASAKDKFYDTSQLSYSLSSTYLFNFPTGKATKPGIFYVTYYAKNPSGITGSATREIVVIDTFKPRIAIVGKIHDTVQVLSHYNDLGAKGRDTFYTPSSLNAIITGSFYKTFKNGTPVALGSYTIIYKVYNPANDTTILTRYVEVIDTIKPTISLKGKANDSIQVMDTYTDPGYTASDYFYTTASLKLSKSGSFFTAFPGGKATTVGTYTVIYTATNDAGLSASVTRTVKVIDSIPPVITLAGKLTDTLCQGDVYVDKGYAVSDSYYANGQIKVDTISYYHAQKDTTPGLHYVQYRATNPSGRSSLSAKRTIYLRRLVDCDKASISESLLENAVKVYPNPTTGLLNIRIDMDNRQSLQKVYITDLMGNLIAEADKNSIQQGNFTFDFSNRPAGMYLVSISSATEKITKQVIMVR